MMYRKKALPVRTIRGKVWAWEHVTVRVREQGSALVYIRLIWAATLTAGGIWFFAHPPSTWF